MHACPVCRKHVGVDDSVCGFCGALLTVGMDESGCRSRNHAEIVLSPACAAITDRGQCHSANEDAVGLQSIDTPRGIVHLLVVCDGVSAAAAADLASAAAVAAMGEACRTGLTAGSSVEAAMASGLSAAQDAVCAIPAPVELPPPATTIVAALVEGTEAILAWMGDSRAYLLEGTGGRQLTQDDSWLNQAVSGGRLTVGQARRHPFAHAITKCLGRIDADGQFAPNIQKLWFPAGASLLLCSDGLWTYAERPSRLAALIAGGDDAQTACRRLVAYANAGGGSDNITAALLKNQTTDCTHS